MYFTTVLRFAAFAVAATAAALPTTPLTTREAVCGVWYDSYLGPGSAGDVLGTGQCQQIKKPGEGPNDESNYTFKLKAACIHCDFFSDENCGNNAGSAGNDEGQDWDQEWPYRITKSFRC
ncbi:hypothetical protein P171DRAFT_522890 [Karstenula rhodostoma CBS 690.94]|uniref:Uncharacterized protein n=1 Tax=Karstenula rhodostoma CBS 690.94 TaxID=1392251 RepID=A0A9P4PDK7_9PLEO|nr:hypothetical protein P171DRAFT_522890 [Karstenula rhodostoma CBS 690.94]